MNTLYEITSKTTMLGSISLILLVTGIAFLIASIVIFILLDIPHSIKVLTGIGANKDIAKINKDNKNGSGLSVTDKSIKAALSWNISGRLDRVPNLDYGKEETQLLVEETTLLDEEETQLLSDVEKDFEMEEDIIITGTEEKI